LSPANGDPFSQELTLELSPLLDDKSASGNDLNTELYLSSRFFHRIPYLPFLTPNESKKRKIRRSPAGFCIDAEEPSYNPRSQNPPDLDAGRLVVIEDLTEYWYSQFKGWALAVFRFAMTVLTSFLAKESCRIWIAFHFKSPRGLLI
jgi:hypothetical protein